MFSDNIEDMTLEEVQKEFDTDKFCEWVFINISGKKDNINNVWKSLDKFVEALND